MTDKSKYDKIKAYKFIQDNFEGECDMKLKTKILSVVSAAVCAVSFCAGALVVNAETYSDEMKYGDYLSYKQVDANLDGTYDYIEISGCDKSANEVTVPNNIDGLPVRAIKAAAFFDCDLRKLDLPDSLVSIGDNAFNHCRRLPIIEIPDSVTSMGVSVFYKCTDLTKLKLSENLTEIGDESFVGCRNLTSISIPKSVTTLGGAAFSGCWALKEISLPNGVKSIGGKNTFNECFNLKSIKIENPECEIYDDKDLIPGNVVIYGYDNSTAYTYSLKYGKSFVSLNSGTVITTPAVTTKPIVATTTVSAPYYETTKTSGSNTVPKITSSNKVTTETGTTDIPVFTEVSTQRPIAGWLITEVSCKASAMNIVMDAADVPASMMLELLSDNGVDAVVYPKLPDGFYITRVFGENGNSIMYNGAENSFVMTGNYAFVDICADKPVSPGKYKIEFDIRQEKRVENLSHDGGICYIYKYNVAGGEFTVPDENAVPGDVNGDGKTTVSDIVEMQKYLTKFKPITKKIFEQLDLNNDSKFNVFDFIILKRQIINAAK